MSTQSAPMVPAIPEDTIANRLILARALAGHLSIREAALRCGIGRGTWQNWERGIREPRLSEARQIAEQLGVRFDWLVEGGPLADPRRGGGGPDDDPGKIAGFSGDTVPRHARRLRRVKRPALPQPTAHAA